MNTALLPMMYKPLLASLTLTSFLLAWGTDATADSTSGCPVLTDWSCANGSACIRSSQRCDFSRDCPAGEDERLCGYACDFDSKNEYEKEPCSTWIKQGFVRTNGNTSFDPQTQEGGPNVDRSVGTETGNYSLFLNAHHQIGKIATLTSPWYGSSGPQCRLNFSTNIFGINVGYMKVFILRQHAPAHEIWNSYDETGTSELGETARWYDFTAALGMIREPFRIEFQVTRGSGDAGHIALDSISLNMCDPRAPSNQECSLREFRCNTTVCIPRSWLCDMETDCLYGEDETKDQCDEDYMPENSRCDFEEDMCNWRNSSNTVINWWRHHGPTNTNHTGPKTDHTLRNDKGFYIYMEANDGEHFDRARIESPVFHPPVPATKDPSSPYYNMCQLRFFYHMYGHSSHILMLNIREVVPGCVDPSCQTSYRRYWEVNRHRGTLGNPIDTWERAVVTLPPLKNSFQLEFEAIRPIRYWGDVAVDDISFTKECFNPDLLNTQISAIAEVHLHQIEGQPVVLSVRPLEDTDGDITAVVEHEGRPVHLNRTHRSENRLYQFSFLPSERGVYNVTVYHAGVPVTDIPHITASISSHDFDNYETITEVVNKSSRFQFKSCANTGSSGPTQYQCNRAYKYSEFNVTVLEEAPFKGVQMWVVPKTAMYSITALGASGGKGVANTEISRGGYASAKFNLTKDEQIYMIVGQQGQSACEERNVNTLSLCRHGLVAQKDDTVEGGGGGGGGGTFVFKIDPLTNEPILLVIAGGGGGKGMKISQKDDIINSDGGLVEGGSGYSAFTMQNGSGGGGGYMGRTTLIQAGQSMLDGAIGGATCPQAEIMMGWQTAGGFGGGGGGCTSGGGGGGYTGGNTSQINDPGHNGMGGSSYMHSASAAGIFEKGTQEGDGEVEIAYIVDCPCSFLCIYFNEEEKRYKCFCPPNHVLAEDGITCLSGDNIKKPSIKLVIIIVSCILGVIIICALLFLIIHLRNKRKLRAIRLERLSNPDYQLGHLRQTTDTPHSMEYNPNYDFGGTKCTLQDLREIPRNNLLLTRALGQGAFGEVYQGYLSKFSGTNDLPVAVKTLPALSTDQAEMDFLMEALIMSKFNHPNIVRFIGVCFEKHPRFIILELLEGGDLKSFLRECRPQPDKPSMVTMLDLVKLALDVAKGCQYLEDNHFIHRDIAARNCLLTTKVPSRTAKIADFGMARDIYRADYYRKGGKAMLPVKWMPPEAFMDGIFTSKTDVWSFGILLWEVFSLGYMPYPGRGNHEVMQLVTAGGRLDPPQNCPARVYHVMTACWRGIPEQRPDFSSIIDNLQLSIMDREVINAPLPVFHRPPSMEKDMTVIRPHDPEATVLSVDPPTKGFGEDSPTSMDHLLGAQSPENSSRAADLKQQGANLSASAESLDALLKEEVEVEAMANPHSSFIDPIVPYCLAQPGPSNSLQNFVDDDGMFVKGPDWKNGGENGSSDQPGMEPEDGGFRASCQNLSDDSGDSGKSSMTSCSPKNCSSSKLNGDPCPREGSVIESAGSNRDISQSLLAQNRNALEETSPNVGNAESAPPGSHSTYENMPPLSMDKSTFPNSHSNASTKDPSNVQNNAEPRNRKREQSDSGVEVDLRNFKTDH